MFISCIKQPIDRWHNTTYTVCVKSTSEFLSRSRPACAALHRPMNLETHMTKKLTVLTFERPLTTVDVVIFTVRDETLQVLLVKRGNKPDDPFPGVWALPGGFVDVTLDMTLERTARRKLLDKTGVKSPYLEQLGSWGGKHRDPRGWSTSHVYFALIAPDAISLVAGGNAELVDWHSVAGSAGRKRLAFDHAEILAVAVERLRSKVEYTSLPAFLLTEPFTLPQLQKMYEIILGRTVDKSGFRTRALAAEFLVEAGEMDVGAPRRAMGYRLEDKKRLVYFPRTFYPRAP
jgi:8-oxo-dGTP diphosphatase